MANDFVSYAAIIATVFNSVASRFIANSFYKKDYETANYYFNSLIAANIAISAVLGLAGVLLVPNLDKRFFPEEWLNNGEEDCNGKKE